MVTGCTGIYRPASSIEYLPANENITMITKDNFKDVLKTLGFQTEGNIFQKSVGETELKVILTKKNNLS